jgi:hypothetical protein
VLVLVVVRELAGERRLDTIMGLLASQVSNRKCLAEHCCVVCCVFG